MKENPINTIDRVWDSSLGKNTIQIMLDLAGIAIDDQELVSRFNGFFVPIIASAPWYKKRVGTINEIKKEFNPVLREYFKNVIEGIDNNQMNWNARELGKITNIFMNMYKRFRTSWMKMFGEDYNEKYYESVINYYKGLELQK